MKISIIIPCYNEEGTIGTVLKEIQEVNLDCTKEIIAIDDGSTDRSSEIIKEFKDVKSIKHKLNLGKGAAIRTGIENCSGDIIVMLDADFEHLPDDMPKLVKPILEGKADVTLGSRFLGEHHGMSRSHTMGNKFLAHFASLLYQHKLTDILTGYRAIKQELLKDISLESNDFAIEPELVAKLLAKKCRVVEAPIKYRYRQKGKSKVSWKQGFISLWVLFKFLRKS